jgi:hypothetical protein
MDITNTRTDTPRTERLLSRMEAEKQDIWQALKTLTEWARGLEIECASWELREQAIAVSENATINGGRGQGLPESREAGQGLGMPSSQAENEATRAGYRAPLPSSSDKVDKGEWPEGDIRRAFVEGARWYLWWSERATMFGAERRAAEAEAEKRYTPSAGRVSDRCQNCPWPKDGCIFPKCGQESMPSHEQPIDIEERIRWHKSEARRLTLESIRGGQPSDIGER